MEDVLDAWDRSKKQPQIKAEYFITYGSMGPLAEAARAAARRLGLSHSDTEDLVRRYQSYPVPLEGPGVRPLPPLLYAIARGSRDHTLERYRQVVLPTLAAVDPPPRTALVVFQAGVHGYERAEEDLPRGVLPAVLQLWRDAIDGGYYVIGDRTI
jgi:acetyl esterase/lipase